VLTVTTFTSLQNISISNKCCSLYSFELCTPLYSSICTPQVYTPHCIPQEIQKKKLSWFPPKYLSSTIDNNNAAA